MPQSIIFLVTTLGFIFGSHSPLLGQKNTKSPSKLMVFKKDNYELKYPETWSLDTTTKTAADFIVYSPLSSDKDEFKENLNLVVQDLKGLNFDLDNFTALSEQQIQSYLEGSEVTENERLKKEDQEYHHLVYTAKTGGRMLRFEQYYWVVNEKAYILSFTAELDQFEKYADISKQILESFTLK
ncbi:hypothetical protein [Fluviicola sp.]|uniref:PsbP-related protein n=1 Tax=Fluviicola sp. TaxID=1917219 RepID=UPI0031DD7998